MQQATIEGERRAARRAAERMAASYGLNLRDTLNGMQTECDVRPRIDGEGEFYGFYHHDLFEGWTGFSRTSPTGSYMSDAAERAARLHYENAKKAAERRGLDAGDASREHHGKSPLFCYGTRRYKATAADHFRLVSALLKDGLGLRRTAFLAGTTTNEVARIWLLMRC